MSIKAKHQEQIEAFVATAHSVGARKLAQCSSGNLSCRVDDEHMLVSASRSWLERLTPDDVALCRIEDVSVVEGRRPSIESVFHAGILASRPDVNVVFHFQAPYATIMCCNDQPVDSLNVIPDVPYYVGPVGRVPFLMPGSQELADAVVAAAQDCDMLLLRNHGQVTVGENFDDCLEKAIFFELACQIVAEADGKTVPLADADAKALRAARLAGGAGA